MRALLTAVSAIALAAVAAAPVATANEIGSVAAVNRDIEGTPPGSGARSLILGDRLIANERLVSSPIGSGQMLFLDQTSLTVSPNSEIVLDKYVYDPDTEIGEIGLTVGRGVLRMIGGRITKKNDAVVKTPSATIGIRGGIALIAVDIGGVTKVMHVAGEYTKITSGGETLNLSRPNAFASIGSGDQPPTYEGVASDEQVGEFYDQMQGGGGGSEEVVDDTTTTNTEVAEANSQEPDAVTDQPISTSGESGENDASAEVAQESIASDPEVQQEVTQEAQQQLVTTETPPRNLFAGYVGGAILVSPGDAFTDPDGAQITDAVGQNFLFADDGQSFTDIRSGSLIGRLENGETVRLPTPTGTGFFNIDPAQTASPVGPLAGRVFADPNAGLYLYYIFNQQGQIGAVFAADPGPTQLRNLNVNNDNFKITPFRVLPDQHLIGENNDVPFLPFVIGSAFNDGSPTEIFFISKPNSPGFALGTTGFAGANTRLTQVFMPVFRLNGNGLNQSYLLTVGATHLVNDGTDNPALSMFTRGSFRFSGNAVASRLAQTIGTTSIDGPGGEAKVFGAGDRYLLLGNSTQFGQSNTDPAEETFVSFTQNIGDGTFAPYGNLHLAQRQSAVNLAANQRFIAGFGQTPASYAAETGRTGATQFGANQQRFMSFAYSSVAGSSSDGFGDQDRFLLRTAALDGGGAASFALQDTNAAIALRLDESVDSDFVSNALLTFGAGSRGAVINRNRYGMREAANPAQFENILIDSGETANRIGTIEGQLPVRPFTSFGTESSARLALVSHGFADSSAIFPPGTDVTPQYLTWGWWTGQYRANADPNVTGDPNNNARVQFHLGTYVAGNRTDVLPTSGTATYNGPVVMNVIDGAGADFVEGGQFQLNWSFGQGSGVAGFAGLPSFPNFTVPVSIGQRQGVNDYGGDNIFGDMALVRVDGSFFDGPQANDARATAGTLRIDDTLNARSATGTFWGER